MICTLFKTWSASLLGLTCTKIRFVSGISRMIFQEVMNFKLPSSFLIKDRSLGGFHKQGEMAYWQFSWWKQEGTSGKLQVAWQLYRMLLKSGRMMPRSGQNKRYEVSWTLRGPVNDNLGFPAWVIKISWVMQWGQ